MFDPKMKTFDANIKIFDPKKNDDDDGDDYDDEDDDDDDDDDDYDDDDVPRALQWSMCWVSIIYHTMSSISVSIQGSTFQLLAVITHHT
eukprot:3155364-Karenia_brevis.AAC.1